jgi:hypothetical protein
MLLQPPPIQDDALETGSRKVSRIFRDWFHAVLAAVVDVSVWQPVAQSLVTFTANGGGTWSVPSNGYLLYAYRQHGTWMHLAFNFQTGTINGAGNELRFTIPKGLAAVSRHFTGAVQISGADNGPALGYCTTGDASNGATTVIRVFRATDASWTNSAAQTGIRGEIAFEVTP